MGPKIRIAVALVAVVVAVAVVVGSGRAQEVARYTQDQAGAGETAYQAECAGCHMSDFAGAFEAPELAGPNFRNTWGERTAGDLLEYIRATMPPEAARIDSRPDLRQHRRLLASGERPRRRE